MNAQERDTLLTPDEVKAVMKVHQEFLDDYHRSLTEHHYEEPVTAMEAEQEQGMYRLELADMVATEISHWAGGLASAIDVNNIAYAAADEIMERFQLRRRT